MNFNIKQFFLLFLALISIGCISFLLVPVASADVIINSQDWKEVYSTMLYAKLIGEQGVFVIGQTDDEINQRILPLITTKEVTYLESKEPYYSSSFIGLLSARKKQITILTPNDENINFDLLENLPDIKKFILIDDSFPYNVIAITPLATTKNYYVIFVNTENIDKILSTLAKRQVDEIFVYGNLEPVVKEKVNALQYQKKIINNGDKYSDNVELIKLFFDPQYGLDGGQLYIYSGLYFDKDLFNIRNPILLQNIGIIPDRVEKFLFNSPIKSVVASNPSVSQVAQYIRSKMGIRSVTKIGFTSGLGIATSLNELIIFPLPNVNPMITITNARYNTYSNSFEMIYKNIGEVYGYFTAVKYRIIDNATNKEFASFSDDAVYYIQEKERKVIIYPQEKIYNFSTLNNSFYVSIDLLFGSDAEAIELYTPINASLEIVDYKDNAVIEIKSLVYDKSKKRFEVQVENKGDTIAYADATIDKIVINDFETTISGDTASILTKSTEIIYVPAELTEKDLTTATNKKVNLQIRYGESEEALIKLKDGQFDFIFKTSLLPWVILLLLIIIVIIIYFVRKKKKDRF